MTTGPTTDVPESEPLSAEAWLDDAALICVKEFEPDAEVALQRGALKVLGLNSYNDLPGGDAPALVVSSARLGYAVRNRECQLVANASDVRHHDPLLATLLDERAPGASGDDQSVVRLLSDLVCGRLGDADAVLASTPGVRPEQRSAVFDAGAETAAMDEGYGGPHARRQLMQFGYLLHRIVETEPGPVDSGDRMA